MRKFLQIALDVVLLFSATFAAFVLRENFEISSVRWSASVPYFVMCAIAIAVVHPFIRIDRPIWRHTTLPNYWTVSAYVLLVVLTTAVLSVLYNGFEGIPRAVPVLQLLLGIVALVGARVMARSLYAAKMQRKPTLKPLAVEPQGVAEKSVLIIGLSRLTETYIQSVSDLASGKVTIVGLLGQNDRQVGRLAAAIPVLGRPEALNRVLYDLEVHGIAVDEIVVATVRSRLTDEALAVLTTIARAGVIRVRFLAEDMGFEAVSQPHASGTPSVVRADRLERDRTGFGVHLDIGRKEMGVLAQRPYWRTKRFIDIVGSALLLLVLAPVFILVAVLVAFAHGTPIMFWQERPGLGGRRFRLYKFRTLRAAQTAGGTRLSDADRSTSIGNGLRRTRLDELPQLISILTGDMSFIGPRPLLPRDQSENHRARLLVRPGLTGWAQVIGGRTISPDVKAALDIWYVQNACLALDFEIALRTIPMIVFGEHVFQDLIDRAVNELRESGVLIGNLDDGLGRPI